VYLREFAIDEVGGRDTGGVALPKPYSSVIVPDGAETLVVKDGPPRVKTLNGWLAKLPCSHTILRTTGKILMSREAMLHPALVSASIQAIDIPGP
jgi:hypothetical protein